MRKAFVMTLKPGSRVEYERRHNPIWPELEAVLKRQGVKNYSIFAETSGESLFAYVELESEEQWRAIAETAECQRWWTHMKDLMLTNADNSPVSIELNEVFHLG